MENNIKFSELPETNMLNDEDIIPIVSNGINKKVSVGDLKRIIANTNVNKKIMILTEDISSGGIVNMPINYKVGANCLDVYLNGELLFPTSQTIVNDDSGHYYEVGNSGVVSNQIRLTNDWSLSEGDTLIFVVRGVYE